MTMLNIQEMTPERIRLIRKLGYDPVTLKCPDGADYNPEPFDRHIDRMIAQMSTGELLREAAERVKRSGLIPGLPPEFAYLLAPVDPTGMESPEAWR